MHDSETEYYTRKQFAELISLSESSVDVMIRRGLVKARRWGRGVRISKQEAERFMSHDHATIWPPKRSGKTTRRLAVVS